MAVNVGDRRILFVEDEEIVAETLGKILLVHGYEVRIAHSAESAIEVVSGWRPDLAIVDVMLPNMNGIELAIVLKRSDRSCRVLLFSGQPTVEELVNKAKREGHEFEILAKPVHPTVMLDAISNLLHSDHCSVPESPSA
jgi:DNA-binding NtrC family response regulator